MSEMQEVQKDNPLRIAWEEYKLTEEFRDAFKWAGYEEYRNATMREIFEQGYNCAKEDYKTDKS